MLVDERGQPAQQDDPIVQAENPGRTSGQALVEYVLIASLVVIGIIAVLTVTGPTVGNIFSNTVYNLLGQTFDPQPMPDDKQIQTQAKDLEQITPAPYSYNTNTPLIPTCASGYYANTWAPLQNDQGTYWAPCPASKLP